MIKIQQLTRLLQLASPALPVGAFSYSQGLEWAVAAGIVRDRQSAGDWIAGVMRASLASFEVPVAARLYRGFCNDDPSCIGHWNELIIAARESAELRAETLQMGYSLKRLLLELDGFPRTFAARLNALDPVAYPSAFACAAAAWDIALEAALAAYAWSWLENQVMAALKSVPLGQTTGQALLLDLGGELSALVARALMLPDDELSNFAPGLAIASSRHETQYSRLFRS
jgi:urease accessory protein